MQFRHKSLILLLMAAAAAIAPRLAWAAVEPVHAAHGMVVSVHELASRAGVEMMRAGGNAVDAAVATGFALAVVHPPAGNLGGGGFMLIRMADGKVHFVDYRETAPAKATAGMYLDAQGNVIEDASIIGYKAIAVPGSVAGMVYAEQKYGKLGLERVMAPAIRLAREGYALAWNEAQDFQDRHLSEFAESKRIFQRNGNYYQAGEVFRQPDLARTLERIAAKPGDFYHGDLARELAAAIHKGGGLISVDDLARYEVKEREPVRGTYRGYEVISAPPPSSGGTVLLESLNILEGYNLAAMGDRSAQSVHYTTEAFRRAFFDRAEFLGDPDFAKIPVAQLVDKKYATAWRESIAADHASASKALKRPGIFSELEQYAAEHPQPQSFHEGTHTTHYSVVDADGNAVAVTTTIVARDGKPVLVLGSPGSSKIITTVANVLMGVIDYGMNIQEAVNAPRFHNQWLPDVLNVERWFSPDTVQILRKMGYTVQYGLSDSDGYWSDGECIAVDQKTGERLGAPDGRNGGKAVGY